MSHSIVILEREQSPGERRTFIGWYRFLQYADMISERLVVYLLGNWERNEPPEASISVIDHISLITHGEQNWGFFAFPHSPPSKCVPCSHVVLRRREDMAGETSHSVPVI